MKRHAVAMIELIIAIVIIAISVVTIPTMVNVAHESAKRMVIDDDVIVRIGGWAIDKFQSRWDLNYGARDSGPLLIAGGDLECSRGVGAALLRRNLDSEKFCDPLGRAPSAIGAGDGNMSRGIEQLNGGNETLGVAATTGETYNINASYSVAYVNDAIAVAGNTATAQWTLGSSGTMNPGPAAGSTHLKRVVIRFSENNNAVDGADVVLTFFKSNIGN